MPFNLKLAWWQTRGQSARVWILIFCIALGVSARVATDSFIAQVQGALAREAQKLLGADIEISGRLPISAAQEKELPSLLPDQSRFLKTAHLLTMARSPSSQNSRLVELRAVGAGYPFYGDVRVSGPDGEARGLDILQSGENRACVQPGALESLEIKLGDSLLLGNRAFTASGILRQDASGGSLLSMGPRVWIALDRLPETGLAGFGSRVSHSVLIALPDPALAEATASSLKKWLRLAESEEDESGGAAYAAPYRVKTSRDKQVEIERFFNRLKDYMNLVSLMALLLGGIGVASVVRGFMAENSESFALLRVLGAPASRIVAIALIQTLGISLLGSAAGALAGSALQAFLPLVLSGLLPVAVSSQIHWPALGSGLVFGSLTACVFSLYPILEISRIRPLQVLRGDAAEKPDRKVLAIFLVCGGVMLCALSVFLSHSLVLGLVFGGSLFAGGLLLFGTGKPLLKILSAVKIKKMGFGIRQGLSNLSRPGLHPHSAVLALGLSAFLLGFLAIYQHSLLRELDPLASGGAPDFFVIDIQDDQVDDLNLFLRERNVRRTVLSPMVKARYRNRNGQPVRPEKARTREEERDQHMRSREQNLSYRDAPGENEILVRGRWLDPRSGAVEISLEESFAKRLGARLGDRLSFDVQGVPVEGTVTSLRKVRWSSFLPTFFILFSPQALADAPKTWVGAVEAEDKTRRGALQTDIARRFPNLTLFDVAEGGEKIRALLRKISWAIGFLAVFSLGAGLVVLLGMALFTARERRKDAALLRTLGAGTPVLAASLAVEFFALGLVSAVLGLSLSLGTGWGLLSFYLNIPFALPWKTLLLLGSGIAVLCTVTGVWACRKSFRARPLETLRSA